MSRVSDIIQRSRDSLSDPAGNRWTDGRLLRLLDEAQKDFCIKALLLRTQLDINVHTGQSNYTLPDNVYTTTSFFIDNIPLDTKTLKEVDLNAQPNKPFYILTDQLNDGIIKLYPEPNIDTVLGVYFVKIPDTIASLTDTLEIPIQYDYALKLYIVGSALRDDSDTEDRRHGAEELLLYGKELKLASSLSSADFTRKSYSTKYRTGYESI